VKRRVLVTGGAGFIGSHVVDKLVAHGDDVVVLDNLEPQVHGPGQRRPEYLNAAVELVVGDIRDRALVGRLVAASDSIVHLAAAVGVAQSMYEMERFVDVNTRGTAILLEAATQKSSKIERIVVASSMSLYGEGRCSCPSCGPFDPALRSVEELQRGDFEVHCPRCHAVAAPAPTPEDARLVATTVYAVTKRDQEDLVMAASAAYGISAAALRLFNVYGPRQSLSNPYTGIAAIFSSRLLNGNKPLVFEDGRQTRDFTHVSDVAEAFVRVLDGTRADGQVFNVGAARPHTLLELGELLAREIGVEWKPEITGAFRKGDIRHCSADGSRLQQALGFRPQIEFRDGVRELVEWVRSSHKPADRVDNALSELAERGLVTRG
jgi:dTDP-L-rhamnose 4-epimerase